MSALLASFANDEGGTVQAWTAPPRPGFRFDYKENAVRLTVEVESIRVAELVELTLRVVDDRYSSPASPRLGDRFQAAYNPSDWPTYVWAPFAEGFFGRFEAWSSQ